ncbi:MAG: DUF2752 domain-containing protein [Bryobacteraceae bacterium]|nr:DUF2752 domain-containing protein [Bryobacteraceae bacterium]
MPETFSLARVYAGAERIFKGRNSTLVTDGAWSHTITGMPGRCPELKRAFVLSWIVLSVAILAILVSPFLLSEETIRGWSPVCEAKRIHGTGCSLCGMTRAFLCLSRGQFQNASRENRASLPLYTAFTANEATLLVFLCRRIRSRRSPLSSYSGEI